MMWFKKGFYTFVTCFFGAALLWCLGLVFFVRQINSYAPNEENTDAVVVLTGGRHRIEEGIALLNSGIGKKLFISGVSKRSSLADIEKKSKVKINDAQHIDLGYEATDTIGNAAEIKKWVEDNHIGSIRLVTSNYHLTRALEEISVYRLPIVIIAHPVYSEKVERKWWRSFATFKLLATEYNKFLYTFINHRLQQLIGE